jgi:hypothetical protein
MTDILVEIIRDEIAGPRPDDEHQMVFARRYHGLGQQERTRWPAARQEFMALSPIYS